MEEFVWQSSTPLALEESEYIMTCGCNILHPFSRPNRDRCTKKCYEKKLRNSIVKDCKAQCKAWFTGVVNSDRRACKKLCKEEGGIEGMTRDDVLDEVAGIVNGDWDDSPPMNGEFNGEPGLAGIGNTNTIIAVIIGVIMLIGLIILIKR